MSDSDSLSADYLQELFLESFSQLRTVKASCRVYKTLSHLFYATPPGTQSPARLRQLMKLVALANFSRVSSNVQILPYILHDCRQLKERHMKHIDDLDRKLSGEIGRYESGAGSAAELRETLDELHTECQKIREDLRVLKENEHTFFDEFGLLYEMLKRVFEVYLWNNEEEEE